MQGSGFYTALVTVLTALTGVAIVAVLVSRNANTQGVIGSFWQGFNSSLGTAVSPVTGGGSATNSNYSTAQLLTSVLPTFGSTANLA